MAKELVVISGKGGTGKTSIVAAFASLARDKVMVDCDVDAADLHIILQPEMVKREDFSGGKSAFIRQSVYSCSIMASRLRSANTNTPTSVRFMLSVLVSTSTFIQAMTMKLYRFSLTTYEKHSLAV